MLSEKYNIFDISDSFVDSELVELFNRYTSDCDAEILLLNITDGGFPYDILQYGMSVDDIDALSEEYDDICEKHDSSEIGDCSGDYALEISEYYDDVMLSGNDVLFSNGKMYKVG